MAPTRSLNVVISGDPKPLGIAAKQADGHLDRLGKSGAKMGKTLALGFATAGAAAGGALVLGLKKSVDAAKEAEKSQARMEAQLKASGASYRAHAKEIDAVIQKHSKLAGVDDEDLQDAFTGIVRATGSVNTAMKDLGLVTDLVRGKNMDAAKAGELLSKVHNGNVSVLKRMGIAIDPVTRAQDKLRESNKNATAEQINAAKAADKASTAQKGIAELQKRFGGQAEAYGKTAAGAQERLGVAVENLQEKIGAKLLPVVANITNRIANFVGQMESGKGAGGRFAEVIRGIVAAVGSGIGKVVDFGKRIAEAFSGGDKGATSSVTRIIGNVREMVTLVTAFVKDLAGRLKVTFSGIGGDLAIIGKAWLKLQSVVTTVIVEVAKRVLPILSGALGGFAEIVRGVIKVIAGLLSGDFKKAWQGAKLIVKGELDQIKAVVRGAWDALGPSLVSLGKFLVRKLLEGLQALPGKLKDAIVASIELAAKNIPKLIGKALGGLGKAITAGIKAGFEKLNPLGDGLGSGDGLGMGMPVGRFGGGLKGARPSMAPFAAAGARFGLGVSSGRRPGAITSSGNVSYHSTGEAIDVAGNPAGMLAYFRYLKNTAGGRLAELIYTPGGAGIKNGRPYTYGGQVAADHFDHVHVAFDSGVPGVGDGLGQFDATSYGPPWGGIQGTGVTTTGVNLKGSPHMYGVAVDPNVIPLGSKLKISPNPFNYGGTFTAFDTGGAIKGHRIDFYDWRGRAKQNGWGHRNVSVSTVGGGSSSGGGSSKPKTQTVTSNPTKGYDPAAMYAPAATRTVTLSNGRKVRVPVDETGPFRPFDGQSIKGINPDAPPAERETSTVGDVQAGGGGLDSLLAAAPTAEDFALSAIARARLTSDNADDIAAATSLRDLRKRAMDLALDTADPRDDAATIDAYLQAVDSLKALTDSTDEANRLAQQRLDVDAQIAANGARMVAIAERSQGLQSQFIAWLSSAMGGSVARGMQAAGTPGVMARY